MRYKNGAYIKRCNSEKSIVRTVVLSVVVALIIFVVCISNVDLTQISVCSMEATECTIQDNERGATQEGSSIGSSTLQVSQGTEEVSSVTDSRSTGDGTDGRGVGVKAEIQDSSVGDRETKATRDSESFNRIQSFIKSYNGRISDEYLDLIFTNCNENPVLVQSIVAISVAETGMGKAVNRQSNFFGWFAGGNKNYDPSIEEMAQVICKGIGSHYTSFNEVSISKYTGGDSTSTWAKNYSWAISKM